MKLSNILKISSLTLSLICQYFIAQSVVNRTVNINSLILWISSILLFYYSFPFKKGVKNNKKKQRIYRNKSYAYLIIGLILVVGIRIFFQLDTQRYHGDEYQTAYFSYKLPEFSKIDWFGVYPEKGAWVSQFPVQFFAFQKLFFNIFGTSTLTIRFSTLPYIFITFLFLYLSVKRLFNVKTALLSIIILGFLSADLYLTSLGLHFISSTAFFMMALYFFILSVEEGRKHHFALLGISLALCYTTYYSSYIAFPSLLLYFVILAAKKKISKRIVINFLLAVGIFIYTTLPLWTYAWKVDNFLTQRIGQVSLFQGEWSPYANQQISPRSLINIASKQLRQSFQSLYKDGIGGHGGYDFGRMALFDKFTFTLFSFGILFFLYKSLVNRSAVHIFMLFVVFSSFFLGIVFTIPPPAYHRFSIAFPLVAVIIAYFIVELSKLFPNHQNRVSPIFLCSTIIVLTFTNVYHLSKILDNEDNGPTPLQWIANLKPNNRNNKVLGIKQYLSGNNSEYLTIENDIRKYPNETVYISAYGSYALGRILFFRFEGDRQFITQPLSASLKEMSSSSLLILHYPNEGIIDLVKERFSHTKVVNIYQSHTLLQTF